MRQTKTGNCTHLNEINENIVFALKYKLFHFANVSIVSRTVESNTLTNFILIYLPQRIPKITSKLNFFESEE